MKTTTVIKIYWTIGLCFPAWIYAQHDETSTESAFACFALFVVVFIIAILIDAYREKHHIE